MVVPLYRTASRLQMLIMRVLFAGAWCGKWVVVAMTSGLSRT
jgi:hypothetical protein